MCHFSVFLFKQKTAYELRISDWSSDVCCSDLRSGRLPRSKASAQGPEKRRANQAPIIAASIIGSDRIANRMTPSGRRFPSPEVNGRDRKSVEVGKSVDDRVDRWGVGYLNKKHGE